MPARTAAASWAHSRLGHTSYRKIDTARPKASTAPKLSRPETGKLAWGRPGAGPHPAPQTAAVPATPPHPGPTRALGIPVPENRSNHAQGVNCAQVGGQERESWPGEARGRAAPSPAGAAHRQPGVTSALMPRPFGIFGKALVVFALAWVARWVLIRWIDGPAKQGSSADWNGPGAGADATGMAERGGNRHQL